jgi:hypothetical protein
MEMKKIDHLHAILTSFAYRSEYFPELDGMLETVREHHPDWPIVVGRGPVAGYDLPTLEVDSPSGKYFLTLPIPLNPGNYENDWRKIAMMKGWWMSQVWQQCGSVFGPEPNRVLWLDADARLRGALDIEIPDIPEVIAAPWCFDDYQKPGYSHICSGMVFFQGARHGKVEAIIEQWSNDCLQSIRNLPPPTVPWGDSDQEILTDVLNRTPDSSGEYVLLKLDEEKYGACPISRQKFARQSLVNHWDMGTHMKTAPESRNANWPPPEEYRRSAAIGDPVPGLVSTNIQSSTTVEKPQLKRNEKDA